MSNNNYKILVVEDDRSVSSMLKTKSRVMIFFMVGSPVVVF